ncbi:MAG TPA: hypothetical protein VEY71_03240 [Chitinophagales bacterium]|nr:hypothetical protein [Chitinophagales bacterium]
MADHISNVQYRETSVPPPARRFSMKHLLLFFVFTAIMIVLMIVLPAFFWVVLPFVCTYLVQAFDAL